MAPYLGRRGYLACGDFGLRVEVVDVRQVFDRLDFLCRALEGGMGEAWVGSYRVTLDEEA